MNICTKVVTLFLQIAKVATNDKCFANLNEINKKNNEQLLASINVRRLFCVCMSVIRSIRQFMHGNAFISV